MSSMLIPVDGCLFDDSSNTNIHHEHTSVLCETLEPLPDNTNLVASVHRSGTIETEPMPTSTPTKKPAIKKCNLCAYTSNRLYNLKVHKDTVHKKLQFQKCEICHHVFETEEKLHKHMEKLHSQREVCASCGKQFKNKNSLRGHMISKHPNECIDGNLFKCTTCDRSFPHRQGLADHMDSHTNYKRHECSKCSAKFCYKSSLYRHITICGGNSLFVCDVCSKGFSLKLYLDQHMAGKHSKKTLLCACGAAFAWRGSLSNHRSRCAVIKTSTNTSTSNK